MNQPRSTRAQSAASPARRVRGVLGLACLLALEAAVVGSLRYSAGDSAQILASLVALGTAVAGVVLLSSGRARAGRLTLAAGGAILLSAGLWCAQLWIRIQLEARLAVIYAYEQRLETGEFPASLNGYPFRDPILEHHIQSFVRDGDGFRMTYFVSQRSASYWYDTRSGWGYYPD